MLVLFELHQMLTSRPSPATAGVSTVPSAVPQTRAWPNTGSPFDSTAQ